MIVIPCRPPDDRTSSAGAMGDPQIPLPNNGNMRVCLAPRSHHSNLMLREHGKNLSLTIFSLDSFDGENWLSSLA